MATEARQRRRRLLWALLTAACALAASTAPVAAQTTPTPRPVPPGEPWWIPVGLQGERITSVHVRGDRIDVSRPSGLPQVSFDAGRTWQDSPRGVGAMAEIPQVTWTAVDGRVGRLDEARNFHPDPGSPDLRGVNPATHVAAPGGLPGVVVAVDRDNVVWRRDEQGHWARALLLLPQHIAAGPPVVTAVAAFPTSLSNSVYLATDGYSVLSSLDGGDDWIRSGPGLPDHVLSLAVDPQGRAVYAGTDDGLWVHHLRALPAPPSYADAALRWRWLGIGLVTLVAAALAAAGMSWLLRPRRVRS